MKATTRIVTHDGVLHLDTKTAKRHLEAKLGNFITKHAHALCNKKYSEIGDYLEANILNFKEAIEIIEDLDLERED